MLMLFICSFKGCVSAVLVPATSDHVDLDIRVQIFNLRFRLTESGTPVCVSEGSLQCPCLENFAGAFCDECAEGYFNFPECTRKDKMIINSFYSF